MKKFNIIMLMLSFVLVSNFASANSIGQIENTLTNMTGPDTLTYNSYVGEKIIANVNFTILNATKYSITNADTFYILNASCRSLANATFSGDVATIQYNFTAGQTYWLMVKDSDNTIFNYGHNPTATHLNTTRVNFIRTEYDNGNNAPTCTDGSYGGDASTRGFGIGIYTGIWNITASPPLTNTSNIIFQSQTPTNATAQYSYTNNNLTIQTNATFFGGIVNTTIYLYNSTSLYRTASKTETNQTSLFNTTFSNLPIGTYRFNATATNTTHINKTSQITFYIYEIIQNGFNSPHNNQLTGDTLFISWNNTITNPNVSNSFTYNLSLYNSTGFIKTLNTTSTKNNYTYQNIYNENLSTGIYILNLTSKDFNNNLASQTTNFNLSTNANLTLQFRNAYNGSSILNNGSVQVYINGITNTYNIINGIVGLDIIKNSTYQFLFNISGFAYSQQNFSTNASNYQNTNFTLYTNNSILINIYDESTASPIYSNISVTFSGTSTTVYYTNTSILYVDNLNDGNYTIIFQGSNYSIKNYFITVGSRSSQTLNAFLSASAQNVVFSILDFDSGSVLEGATMSQYRLINNTWTLLDSKLSDITGRVQLSYLPAINYRFVVSFTNYQSQTFNLNPVLFSTYDIRLRKITSLIPSNTPSGTGASITYNPTIFYNNRTNNFTWNIASPIGSLTSYSLNLAYPGGSRAFTGSNAIGEQININMTINGANLTSRVTVGYCYQSTTSANFCFNYSYIIANTQSSNNTFLANANNTYGLGNWERVLIMTLIIIVVTAVAFAFTGLIPGLIMTVFLMSYFLWTGFVPLWSVAIPLLFGSLIIMFSGGKR